MGDVNILHLLHVSYHGAKEERTRATAQLEAAMGSADAPHYLITLLQAGFDSSRPAEQSQSALLYAKNSLLHTVDEEALTNAPHLVEEMQQILYKGTLQAPESHRRIACACVSTVMSTVDWDYMSDLMPCVGVNLSQTPVDRSLAVLELLYTSAKRYKIMHMMPMPVKLSVCGQLVPVLAEYFAYNDFRVSHLVFKIMECVVEVALQVNVDRGIPAAALDYWITAMHDFPEAHHSAATAAGGKVYASFARCVKRIAMISFSILNDATRRKKPAPIATHFLKTHAASFMTVWQYWLQYCLASSDRSTHKKSEMFVIRFLKLCTLDETLYLRHIRPNAMHIIEHYFFPYLNYNEEDEEVLVATDGLSEYAAYLMDESNSMSELTQRQAASHAILAMIGGKKKFHDSSLLQEILGALSEGLAREDTQETFRSTFGFLHLLFMLRKYLRAVPIIWEEQMAQVLMKFVAPRVRPSVLFPPLRYKAVQVCQHYAKAPMPSEGDFADFVRMLCALVEDSDPRMRLSAIDALCTLLEMKRARPYLRPVLVPLVEECMLLMEQVQTAFIPAAILHLATHFAPELSSVMGKLGCTLIKHFLAMAYELETQEDMAGESVDLGMLERASFTSDTLLDAIYTVVLSCQKNSTALERMRPDLLRLVTKVLQQPDSFDYIEKVLGILLHVVCFAKPIPSECWDTLPLLFSAVDSGIGVDYFHFIEEVLDNFISGGTVEYLSSPHIMAATYNACQKMLVGGVVCSSECQIAACQLVEAMLHQAKGHAQAGLFDADLPRFVMLLLQALVHPDILEGDVHTRIWIVAALMDGFFYNADATLHTLVQLNAYPPFFDGLFHLFRGGLKLEAAASPTNGKRRTKSKRSAKSNDYEQAAEVLEKLSLLTRKVMVLGLTSLLQGLIQPNTTSHPCYATFAENYLEPTLALIQYCIFINEPIYETRCGICERAIQDIHNGVEEDVEDVDIEDEAILGVDGGDDTADGSVYDDVDSIEADDFGENSHGAAGLMEEDEGDDYESPIDEINEVQFFIQWAALMPQQPDVVQQAMTRVLKPESAYVHAAQVAHRYRELSVQLEAAMQEDYKQRANCGNDAMVTGPGA